MQIAQQISAALPTSLDTAEKNETYKAFLGAFEAALWRIQDAESSQTVHTQPNLLAKAAVKLQSKAIACLFLSIAPHPQNSMPSL